MLRTSSKAVAGDYARRARVRRDRRRGHTRSCGRRATSTRASTAGCGPAWRTPASNAHGGLGAVRRPAEPGRTCAHAQLPAVAPFWQTSRRRRRSSTAGPARSSRTSILGTIHEEEAVHLVITPRTSPSPRCKGSSAIPASTSARRRLRDGARFAGGGRLTQPEQLRAARPRPHGSHQVITGPARGRAGRATASCKARRVALRMAQRLRRQVLETDPSAPPASRRLRSGAGGASSPGNRDRRRRAAGALLPVFAGGLASPIADASMSPWHGDDRAARFRGIPADSSSSSCRSTSCRRGRVRVAGDWAKPRGLMRVLFWFRKDLRLGRGAQAARDGNDVPSTSEPAILGRPTLPRRACLRARFAADSPPRASAGSPCARSRAPSGPCCERLGVCRRCRLLERRVQASLRRRDDASNTCVRGRARPSTACWSLPAVMNRREPFVVYAVPPGLRGAAAASPVRT
jgi:hypothetical protein